MTAPRNISNGAPNGAAGAAGLGREVERLARRQGELEGLVQRLAEDIATCAPPAGGDEEPSGLRPWLTADDPERARTDLAELARWVGLVYLRYEDAVLPSCWAWHPGVVEELWWLRHAHTDAFDGPRASWREVGDWHDRYRPGVVARIRAAVGGCELSRHAPGGDRAAPHPPPGAPLAAHLDAVATQWADQAAAPEPTEEQLTQAQAVDHPPRGGARR